MKRIFTLVLILALAALAPSALFPRAFAEETAGTAIYDCAGFAAVADDPSGDYYLASDIVLPDGFSPIEEFSGSFDGRGHKISYKASGAYDAGFAPFMKNTGSIFSLAIECDIDVSVGEDGNVGGVVANNYGFVTDCSVSGTIRVTASPAGNEFIYAGGAVGYSEGDISGCVSTAAVGLYGEGTVHAGGVVGGTFECVVSTCESSADVIAAGLNASAGGVVGECDGKAGYCSFSGTVKAKAVSSGKNSYAHAGGISGYALDHMVQCENSGTVIAVGDSLSSAYAGGGCGIIYGRINRFENSGAIRSEAGYAVYAGGAAGRACEEVISADNTAVITAIGEPAAVFAGGVAGKAASLENCSSDSDVYAVGNVLCAGGVGGESDKAADCVSDGVITVSAKEMKVGGILGTVRFASGCSSSCTVAITGGFCEITAGGVIGKVLSSVSASEFSGRITAETSGGYVYAGGIVGYNASSVINCKATPSLTVRMETNDASGVVAAGCIAGGNYGKISACRGTAKIYAFCQLESTVRGSGRKISLFVGNNAGLSRVGGTVSESSAESRINAYLISGGAATPKYNYD